MDEDEINYTEKELFVLASEKGKDQLLRRITRVFKYIRLLKKEDELKRDKLIKLYEDNMTLHKEIVLLLENEDK